MADTILHTRAWVQALVIDKNLCPFAKRELVNDRVRFSPTSASSQEQLLIALQSELMLLNTNADIETTLLIHSEVLQDFDDYNVFLDYVDELIAQMGLEGVYQVASFHPHYQFEGTGLDDAENFTNRSPYPMLHLIREASLERAIERYPDVEQIPERNILAMKALGEEQLKALLASCTRA